MMLCQKEETDHVLQQVAKIMETLHLLAALSVYLLSLTMQPPPPLISVASKTKNVENLNRPY